MNFKDIIIKLEEVEDDNYYLLNIGQYPILITAVHTMEQLSDNWKIKFAEPLTKAIALYVSNECNTTSFIKTKDTGLDSNRDNYDSFKRRLIELVENNNIKLVIDLHGAKNSREFDIEFGTLNNLTADFSTIKELEEALNKQGINNVHHNDPFKGGAITKYLYGLSDVEVIQLEINGNYRDINQIEKVEQVCNALIKFINQYIEYTNR